MLEDKSPNLAEKLAQAVVEVRVPARYEYLSIFGATIREYCAALPVLLREIQAHEAAASHPQLPQQGYSHFVYSVELVVQEAASNVIRHGYGDGSTAGGLQLTLGLEENPPNLALVLVMADTAPAFDPTRARIETPNPLDPRESGYGLYLIHKLTDRLEYTRQADKNYLKMVKYLQ